MMGHETCRGESLGFYLKEFVGLDTDQGTVL